MNQSEYKMNYNKKHFIRVPLDVKIAEYNALKEFCRDNGIGINTYIRKILFSAIPPEYMERHKDDTEKER